MGKAKNKTVPTSFSAEAYVSRIEDEQQRKDCELIMHMMREISKEEPVLWGTSIVGFGQYHYRYASGREGDFMKIGFSPRKQNISLYLTAGFDKYDKLLKELGKYSTGKSCLYIKKLEDVDFGVLKEITQQTYDHMTEQYG
jgi:hypothetical protein